MTKEQKRWLLWIVLVVLVTALILGRHPVMRWNSSRLKAAVQGAEGDTVTLNEVVPFGWDTVYTFAPYESKAEMEETIGFSSSAIQENWINEGMVHLLFVKDQNVVASVLGYPEELGYSIDFNGQVTRAEEALFRVERKGDVTRLIQAITPAEDTAP